jgi:hypothetical protein
MCSSSSPSSPKAVSAALACSVYTVQPSDRRHAHSLLLLRSKVICVLSSSIPCTSVSRVPEPYQSYPTSPPMTPAVYSAIPYSTTLTSPLAIRPSESPPLPSLPLPPQPSLSFAIVIAVPSASASAASASASASAYTSAAIYCRLLLPLVLYHRKRNRPKLFGSLRRSFL